MRIASHTLTIATRNSPLIVARECYKPKSAISWLRKDIKYHALINDIDQKIRPDPAPHPDRYITFDKFVKQESHQKKEIKQSIYKR